MSLPIFTDRLTPRQTAEILGVTPGTLSVWRATKRYPLPYVKIGYKVFYRGEDVKAFIESRICSQTPTK
jgi:hypothetical protein